MTKKLFKTFSISCGTMPQGHPYAAPCHHYDVMTLRHFHMDQGHDTRCIHKLIW